MKVKRDRHLLAKLKRRIQDVPFYALKYEKDDLPFDPAKSFILEQIGKLVLLELKTNKFPSNLWMFVSS